MIYPAITLSEHAIHPNALLPTSALKELFEKEEVTQFGVCIIERCYSSEQAKAISETNAYVIGANDSIYDNAGIDFAVAFYTSLSEGRDYKTAFQYAKVGISTHIEDANIPGLWYKGKKILYICFLNKKYEFS